MKKFKRWLLWALVAMIGIVVVYHLWIVLHLWWWVDHNPATSAFMEQRLEVIQEKKPDAKLRHQWVGYEKISVNLKRAIIASEDGKFLDHDGFDWDAIQKAYEKNQKKGKYVAGGSTISQQLAKNLFLSSKKTPWRKIEEAVITVLLEQMWSKRRILEVYLNIIEWGNGVFGAEAAANHYYGIGAGQLTSEQSARLAAIVPNPRFYDRNRNTPGIAKKAGIILERMSGAQVP